MPRRKEWLDQPDGEGFFWVKDERMSKDKQLSVACVSLYRSQGLYFYFHMIGYNSSFNQDDLLKPSFNSVKWQRINNP